MVELRLKRLPHGEGLPLPSYATAGAAGLDLAAAIAADESVSLPPGGRVLVPTGLLMEIAPGHEAQVRPRSGLALKHGITVLNSPGTIDCDYRGEVKVLLVNLGTENFTITRGLRIAQLVICPVITVRIVELETLEQSERGMAGFGSTGV